MGVDRRLKHKDRKALLLEQAMVVASKQGYAQFTRKNLADRAKVHTTLVTYYFGNMNKLRNCIMREAVRTNNYTIVGQGLANRDPIAKKASPYIRRKALEQLQ